MGSTSDMAHCERIRKACNSYRIPCYLRVTSAHKGPDETLRIKSEYEGKTRGNVCRTAVCSSLHKACNSLCKLAVWVFIEHAQVKLYCHHGLEEFPVLCFTVWVFFFFSISSGDGVPTIFVAVAGRSNGLGPVMSGNTVYPVINCPPVTSDWGAQDVWSSLRMPSGKASSVAFGQGTSRTLDWRIKHKYITLVLRCLNTAICPTILKCCYYNTINKQRLMYTMLHKCPMVWLYFAI